MSEPSLIDLFHTEVREHTARLCSGLATGGDPRELFRAAHSLKGATRIMGLLAAERVAKALESELADKLPGMARLALLERGARLLVGLAEVAEEDLFAWEASNTAVIDAWLAELGGPAPVTVTAVEDLPPEQDDVLLDLFRSEMEAHTATLSAGLLAIESAPDDADEHLDACMRAAHSIKGAARVVELPGAVSLAHAMEDTLTAWRDRHAPVDPGHVELLLAANDLLLEAARATTGDAKAWFAERRARLEDLTVRVRDAASGNAPVAAPPPPRPAASPEPPAPAAPTSAWELDRVVRVSARRMGRLMDLAGETLVEARRLEPFSARMRRALVAPSRLVSGLTSLRAQVSAGASPAELIAALDAERDQALAAREVLAAVTAELEQHIGRSDDVSRRLFQEALGARMRPFGDVARGLPRLTRDLSRKLGKPARLTLVGEEVGVDRDVLEKIEAPLGHLLRNALDHGLETPAQRLSAGKPERGEIRIEARHFAGTLSITVSDDGRGIDANAVRKKALAKNLIGEDQLAGFSDAAALELVFAPGFSTRDEVTEVSGRGVGLDVVASVVREVGGSVRLTSTPGQGTSFVLQLPVTLSVIRALIVEIAGEPHAFPLKRVERIARVRADEVQTLEGRAFFALGERHVSLVPAHEVLELPGAPPPGTELPVVVLGDKINLFGIVVDRFIGEQDIVVRPLDPRLGKIADVSAASILADGRPLVILDVDEMCRSVLRLAEGSTLGKSNLVEPTFVRKKKRVLVVDDSITVREVERQLLGNRGYDVAVAVDGLDAWNLVRRESFDLILTDLDMPRMHGIELVKALKNDSRLRSLPIMIVSYRDRPEDRLRGLEAGADYYLTKSNFHDTALLSAVEELIGGPDDPGPT